MNAKQNFIKNISFAIAIVLFLIIPRDADSQVRTIKAKNKSGYNTTITNFNANGQQVSRFSTVGEAIDAHDGEIAFFNGVYYLYGTSYGCGFQWGKKDAPFCGFKTYSSTDMVHWTDRGFLFDANTSIWQVRCNGNTYGCFRPHVIFNKKTSLYVLWINVYDNRVGFRVFTSKNPTGPFVEAGEPKLAVNSDSPVAGLNNGDHDTFVDKDGTGYIAYTDWRTKGTIVIERLSPDYLSGTGEHVKAITPGKTEAPSLFLRKGIYYLTYSDPNCGYCSGTGTSYRTAKSPLGPWSAGIQISNNSCGGQPSFVSPIELTSGTIYLYGSDLWNDGAKNESLANYYWAPLTFAADGSINPMICQNTVTLSLASGAAGKQQTVKDLDNNAGIKDFRRGCDINENIQRSQGFKAKSTGTLTSVSFTSFKNDYPDADLQIEIYNADQSYLPTGAPISSARITADAISWSPGNILVHPNIPVVSGKRYTILLKSASSKGCYGFLFNDSDQNPPAGAAYSADKGANFSIEKHRLLKFQTTISRK